ncbi:MAG: hypothetical protein H0V80_03560, partial [Acidobacteria bacterium]|nr:hypothetical protein [Acidobacteriota bacterium]
MTGLATRGHFLEVLHAELRRLTSPEEILRTATALLGAYLDVMHCAFAEMAADGTAAITGQYRQD